MSLPKPYYQDDYCTIFNGDCRDILPHLPKVDLVLADPPYGIPILHSYNLGKRGRLLVDGHEFPPVYGNDSEFDPRILFGKFPCILWGANHYAHKLPHRGGWLIWDKREDKIPERTQADCEMAWDSTYRAARIFRHYWDGMMKASERGIAREHPTQKPIQLMEWCLSFYPKAQTILDPFMGSGTTLVAAKSLGRKAIGIEIEEKYCRIARDRLRQEYLNLK